MNMRIEDVLTVLDYSLSTRRQRHIIGGILMSVSLLFGGLAVTVLTLKKDYENEVNENERIPY